MKNARSQRTWSGLRSKRGTVVNQPTVLPAETLHEQSNQQQIDIVEQSCSLFFQVRQVEHELNYQRQDQQDVDVFEVSEGDGSRELKKLRLRLLISDPKCDRIDGFIPSLLEEEDNFLMTRAGAVAELLIIRVIIIAAVWPTVFVDIHTTND